MLSYPNRLLVTTGQRFRLTVLPAMVDRTHGMDHVLRWHSPARCNDCLTCREAADLADDLPAFCENRRASRAMNGAIHTTPTQQRRICGIHDGIRSFGSNVGRSGDLNPLSVTEQKPHIERGR